MSAEMNEDLNPHQGDYLLACLAVPSHVWFEYGY